MPAHNSITGQGTPPPADSSYATISLTETDPPLEAPEPSSLGGGDGLDVSVSFGGGGGPPIAVSSMLTPRDPAEPPPTPPPYEPKPGTNAIERALIAALDAIHDNYDKLKDLAKDVDSRNPLAPGYLDGVLKVGEQWGKDLKEIVGPDPKAEPRPKPWVW